MNHQPAKPIEAGCMAMIIRAPIIPEAVGAIVTVIAPSKFHRGQWDHTYPTGNPHPVCSKESSLIRIDNPDIQDQLEAEKANESLIERSQPWTDNVG